MQLGLSDSFTMEASTSVPQKRLHTMQNVNECVREFRLPRQFPSTVSNLNLMSKNSNAVVNQTSNPTIANALNKVDSIKRIKVSSSLNENSQKWRIKTPNGKDLGEIKVHLLPNNGKIIKGESSKISNKLAPTCKSSSYPNKKLIKILPKTNVPTSQAIVVNSNRLNANPSNDTSNIVTINNSNSVNKSQIIRKQQPLILGKRKLSSNSNSKYNDIDEKNDYISRLLIESPMRKTFTNDHEVQNLTLNAKDGKFIIVKPNQLINLNDFESITPEGNILNQTCNLNNSNSKIFVLKSMTSNEGVINSIDEFEENKNSVESCEDDANETSESDVSEIHKDQNFTLNRIQSVGIRNLINEENKKTNFSNQDIVINIGSNSSQMNNFDESQNHSNKDDIDESQTQLKLGKNVMVVVPNNLESDMSDDTCSSKNYLMNLLLQKIPSEENEAPSEEPNISEKNLAKDDFSDNMKSESTIDVLEEAFGSITDKKLRSKALKVLAECGISLERKVPARPPPNLISVKDSLVQTDIFGLLEDKNFIYVDENIPGIERLPQSNRYPYNCCASKKPTAYEKEIHQLNTIIDGHISNNSKASKIKKILTQPDPKITKIHQQLRNDFENCKNWDDHGLCNLHKAVLDERINDARRHILILNTRKESIDLKTSNGKTSLELAIEHNVSSKVVKLLLNKGAQPILEEPAHDSALHIACKISSPVVLQLISSVSTKALLNYVDSEGYAAIHYCAKTGNIAALDALLKAGADVNLRDNKSGRTALFHALENDFNDIAQRLVHGGANASVVNFSGQNVLPLIDGVKSLALRTVLHRAVN